jgi:hypothetical protein
MPGLERLLRNLYGSTPQIDLDKKLARSLAFDPVTLDFPKLFDGMKRANVDLLGVTIQVTAEIKGGKAAIRPTGQTFDLEGAPADGPAERRTFKVLDFQDSSKVRLRLP